MISMSRFVSVHTLVLPVVFLLLFTLVEDVCGT